jgi:hypothetical protein
MAVNYDFDAAGPTGRLVAVSVSHSFAAYGDAYKKLADERKALLAEDFGPLQQKSPTEFTAMGAGIQATMHTNADTGFLYETYRLSANMAAESAPK